MGKLVFYFHYYKHVWWKCISAVLIEQNSSPLWLPHRVCMPINNYKETCKVGTWICCSVELATELRHFNAGLFSGLDCAACTGSPWRVWPSQLYGHCQRLRLTNGLYYRLNNGDKRAETSIYPLSKAMIDSQMLPDIWVEAGQAFGFLKPSPRVLHTYI
jgi:hypothetical protein